jgi:hypothetical protein
MKVRRIMEEEKEDIYWESWKDAILGASSAFEDIHPGVELESDCLDPHTMALYTEDGIEAELKGQWIDDDYYVVELTWI